MRRFALRYAFADDCPGCPRRPVDRELHGEFWTDEFGWLRDPRDPEVLDYLNAENVYVAESTSRLEGLREAIFNETRALIQETDLSAPARRGEWWYGRRTEEGKQYPLYLRWHLTPDGEPDVILDQNELADDRSFCDIGQFSVSFDQKRLAYSVDHSGNETFALRFRDLTTGQDLVDEIEGTYYGGAWSADGSRFFYTTLDQAHRSYRIWQHVLGRDQAEDALVFQEDDERFDLELGLTRDRRYVVIAAGSSTTSETLFIPSDSPDVAPEVLLPRADGVRYRAEHHQGRWLVVTDDAAPNGRLIAFEMGSPADQIELMPHDPLTKVGRVLPFAHHLVVTGRRNGNPAITVIPDRGGPFDLDVEESAYRLAVGENLDYDAATFRFTYESFLAPRKVIDLDLDTGQQTVIKETPAPGYDPSRYEQRRIWAPVEDAVIPITLVHRKDLALPAPTLLYGYGAYGFAARSVVRLEPVLAARSRGRLCHRPHPRRRRAGQALARRRPHAEQDATRSPTSSPAPSTSSPSATPRADRLAHRGGSAGGLLMGAVINMRPDLFKAACRRGAVRRRDQHHARRDPAR